MPILIACARRCTAPWITSGTDVTWGRIMLVVLTRSVRA